MLPGLLLLIALAAALGLTLLTLGLRGRRINDHPICRRCKFDLVGTYPAAERCPECGKSLDTHRSVRLGDRRLRRGMLIAAVPLLAVGLGGGGLAGWAAATSFNWYGACPEWLLESLANSGQPDRQGPAVGELAVRLSAGELDRDRATRLVTRGLAIQADAELPWRAEWGDLILDGTIYGRGLPIDCVFEVWARSGGREQRWGVAVFPRGGEYGVSSTSPMHGPIGETIDLVLRATAEAARQHSDFASVWGGEIVIEGVPVLRADAPSGILPITEVEAPSESPDGG